MNFQILPSLLAADMGRLTDEAKRAEDAGADALHLDIMDGVFVPNISFGPAVVETCRRAVRIPLNVHLMLLYPAQYLTRFIDAGADSLLIHIEAESDVPAALERIRELGARPGITLNPKTPAAMIAPVLGAVDEVLCMTVQPGYGGQSFMPEVLPKIRAIRDMAKAAGLDQLDIMVDGGVDHDRAADCAAQGANMLVAGTFLFKSRDMASEIATMRSRVIKAAA